MEGQRNQSVHKGYLVTFGCNDDGQLGLGEKVKPSGTKVEGVSSINQPRQVTALNGYDVIAVSCGSRHTLALTSSGEVLSWGWGQMGQLGHANFKSMNTPTRIQYFVDHNIQIITISAGGCHSVKSLLKL